MNMKLVTFGAMAILAIAAPAAAFNLTLSAATAPWEAIHCESPEADENEAMGLDRFTHTFPDPTADDPFRTVTVHVLCLGEPTLEPLTDCTATGWSHTGWKWNVAENYKAQAGGGITSSSAVSIFQTSGEAWDGQVAANIYGTVSSGSGSVPVYNNVNQFNWANLASSTIASTWTWSSGGVASESDASYNTDFGWSTTGASGKMDLQNIATHEIGHTVGMGHSSSGTCLTMYPSGSLGETQKRTLGDGDINGVKARYP